MSDTEKGDSYKRVVKGKLKLKGLDASSKDKKRSSKKRKQADSELGSEEHPTKDDKNKLLLKPGACGGVPGKDAQTYAELFPIEAERQAVGKGKSTCYGMSYRPAPTVLHGYKESWQGKQDMSPEERLDLRAATKADRYCK